MKKTILIALLLICGAASASDKKIKLSPADLQKRQAVIASAREIVPGR
jgi:hypothetical protein